MKQFDAHMPAEHRTGNQYRDKSHRRAQNPTQSADAKLPDPARLDTLEVSQTVYDSGNHKCDHDRPDLPSHAGRPQVRPGFKNQTSDTLSYSTSPPPMNPYPKSG